MAGDDDNAPSRVESGSGDGGVDDRNAGTGGDHGSRAVRGPRDVLSALRYEIDAAKGIMAVVADIIGDDDELLTETLEGETDIHAAIGLGLDRILSLDVLIDGADMALGRIKQRRDRLDRQRQLLREAIAMAMETANVRKIEHALGTVSLRSVAPSVLTPVEADIPSEFWKPQPPKLDRRALLAALKDGRTIPGATLSNGGQTIQIK